MISVRPYARKDYRSVKEILKEAGHYDDLWDSEENISGIVLKDPESILVAVDSNRIVGVLYIVLFGANVAWIFRLAVRKDYRNQGIASLLIKHAESLLQIKGIKEVGMYVNANDSELNEFYEKRKFHSSKKPYIYMWRKL